MMHIALSPQQEAFRAEVREYFDGLVTPEIRAGLGVETGPGFRELMRQIGSDGWLGLGYPTEWGGAGASVLEQMIFSEEADRARVPLPHLTISTVGPQLLANGTREQQERFIPGILTGEIMFAIGYSEEGAGTDLASLKTRAVRDGGGWLINGQKLYTSVIHEADYVWLAARTDPDAQPAHRGISIFIVPTDADGFSWTAIDVISDHATAATYYEDVRVPAENLVGPENGGWGLLTSQLNRERAVMFTGAHVQKGLEETTAWARRTVLPDGRRVIDEPWVQLALAEVQARTRFSKLLGWRIALDIEADRLDAATAATGKVYATEHALECYRLLLEVYGAAGRLRGDPDESARLDLMYRFALIQLFGGGANDVLREFITTSGLGMPRSR